MEYARMRKLRTRVKGIIIAILLFSTIAAAAYYYFQIYLYQIKLIEAVEVRVKQNKSLNLPATVKATLRNGTTKEVPVQWNQNIVDTSEIGTVDLKGTVNGYDNTVSIYVTIYHYIEQVDKPSVLHIAKNNKLDLPEYVTVNYSLGITGKEKILWDTSKIDLTKAGKYEASGQLAKKIECEDEIKAYIEIIDIGEAVKRIMFQNEFVQTSEVKATLEKVNSLPIEILEMLMKSNISIKYVNQQITDMPEFSNIKEDKNSDMRVFGVFKYPNIVVDYTAKDYLEKDGIDSFEGITMHEIGHAYDHLFSEMEGNESKALSSSDQFQSIWQEEATKLFKQENTLKNKEYNDYYSKSCYEYFAQCFAFYFSGENTKDFLKEKAPKSYDYIKSQVDNK